MQHIGKGPHIHQRFHRTMSLVARFAGEIEQVLRRWLWTQKENLIQEHCVVELKQKLHFRKEPYILSLQIPGELHLTPPPTMTETAANLSANAPESVRSYSSPSGSEQDEDFEFLPQEETRTADTADAKSERTRMRSNPVFSKGLFVPPMSHFAVEDASLQRWFGLSRFVLLRAGSQSGRILDAQEANTLLSAASVALSEFLRPLAILIPIQNAFRDAYKGVAVVDGRSVFFDIDSSHLIQQSDHLRSVAGQLQVLAKQIECYSPKGARLCEDISCGVDSAVEGYEVQVSSCVTYKLPLPTTSERLRHSTGDANLEQIEAEAAAQWSEDWDDGCVWQPWGAEKDPVASLELDLVWGDVELTPDNPTPVLSAMNAAIWRISALSEERQVYESWAIFSSKNSFNRRHLRLPSVGEMSVDAAVTEFDEDNFRSLSARLNALLQARFMSEAARSVGELASEDWWEETGTRGPSIPPEDVFKESIEDMFGEEYSGRNIWSMTKHVDDSYSLAHKDKVSTQGLRRCPLSRMLPLDSLTARLGLHAVVYRNARAVALLWSHFIQVIRLHYWEKLKHIPLFPLRA